MFNTTNQRLSTLMIIREQNNWKYLTLHSINSLYSFIFEDKIKFQILGTQYWHFQNLISMYKDEFKENIAVPINSESWKEIEFTDIINLYSMNDWEL